MVMRRWRGTCNFEASFNRALTNFPLFWLSRGNMQLVGARSTKRRDTHRNVFNSPLFHNIGDSYAKSRLWIFWGWPDATYCIPLLLWTLDYPPSICSLIHARTNFSHHLRTTRSLHLAPGFKNGPTGYAVTNCRRCSQHSDVRVRKEVSLSEMRIPHGILHAKQTLCLAKHHTF